MTSDVYNVTVATVAEQEKQTAERIWFSLVLTFIWTIMSPCPNGHYCLLTFLATAPSFLFAILSFLNSGKSLQAHSICSPDSLVSLAGIILLGVLLVKNLSDVLLFGHDAILKF